MAPGENEFDTLNLHIYQKQSRASPLLRQWTVTSFPLLALTPELHVNSSTGFCPVNAEQAKNCQPERDHR